MDLQRWVGASEQRCDWVDPNRVAAWHATLDRELPFPEDGAVVDPGFHWTLFPPLARQSELGEDGHAARGGFLPPIDLPRRMWAGSRLWFHRGLRVGERVDRQAVIERIEEKSGKSGRLVFVVVRHRVFAGAELAIEEEQDLVYREAAPTAGAAPAPAPVAPRGPWHRTVVPDPVLLFRYSALTFNGHRIHYDQPYATGVEGYPGLVVHGPLLATLLLDLLRRHGLSERLERFGFRALRPTYDIGPFAVDGGPGADDGQRRLWSCDNQGALAMEAEAGLR